MVPGYHTCGSDDSVVDKLGVGIADTLVTGFPLGNDDTGMDKPIITCTEHILGTDGTGMDKPVIGTADTLATEDTGMDKPGNGTDETIRTDDTHGTEDTEMIDTSTGFGSVVVCVYNLHPQQSLRISTWIYSTSHHDSLTPINQDASRSIMGFS